MGRDPLVINTAFLKNHHHPAARVWRYLEREGPETIEAITRNVTPHKDAKYGYQVLRRRGWIRIAGIKRIPGRRTRFSLYEALQEPVPRPSIMLIAQRLPSIHWRIDMMRNKLAKAIEYNSPAEQKSAIAEVHDNLTSLLRFMGLDDNEFPDVTRRK